MFETPRCRFEPRLRKNLDAAIISVARLGQNDSACPVWASKSLEAAQTAWIKHRRQCSFCRLHSFTGFRLPSEETLDSTTPCAPISIHN